MKNTFKKAIALILVLISLVSTLAIPINVSAASEYYVDVISEKVNVFTEPSKSSAKVHSVYEGDVLCIVDSCVNSYGNTWLKTKDNTWIYVAHTKKHTKHVGIMCSPGSTSYEFIDPDNHNKVVSSYDICGCGAKCNEKKSKTKENHFFENKVCVSCGYQAVYQTETFSEPVYIVIVDNNTPIYAEPTRYSTRKGTLNNEDITKSTAKVTNMYNNVWFAVDSGGYVFSDHIADHIHEGVKSSAFPANTTYNSIDENKHHIIKSYDKLCSCNFKVGSYSEESDERHNFDSNNYCNDCKYQRPVSIMLPETTTTTEPSTEPETKFTPPYANTTCVETATIKGEKIDSYTESHLNSHSFVEVYEKICPTCGISHNSFSTYESAYYVDSVTEEHFTDTNEYGESYCTVCGFNITQALLNKDDALMQIHLSLGTLGMFPVVGEVFDAIDATIYIMEGAYAEAGLSAMSLVPVFGNGSGAAKIANTTSDIIRSYDRKKDLAKLLDTGINSVDDIFTDGHQSYRSFASFKYHNGRAGDGMEWHHIVEQVQGRASRSGFSSEWINSSANMIPLTKEEHRLVTSYYKGISPGTNMSVRDYMSTLPYEEQYKQGLEILQKLGIIP